MARPGQTAGRSLPAVGGQNQGQPCPQHHARRASSWPVHGRFRTGARTRCRCTRPRRGTYQRRHQANRSRVNADKNSGGANGQCPAGRTARRGTGSPVGERQRWWQGHPVSHTRAVSARRTTRTRRAEGRTGRTTTRATSAIATTASGAATPHTPGARGRRRRRRRLHDRPERARVRARWRRRLHDQPDRPGVRKGWRSDCTTNPTGPGCTQGGGGGLSPPRPTGHLAARKVAAGTTCVPTAANHFCSTVLGEKVSTPPAAEQPNAEVLSESVTSPPTSSSLPATGTTVMPLISAGILALFAGGLLLVAARRRFS